MDSKTSSSGISSKARPHFFISSGSEMWNTLPHERKNPLVWRTSRLPSPRARIVSVPATRNSNDAAAGISPGSPTCPKRTSSSDCDRDRCHHLPPRLPPPKLDSRGLASLTLIFLPCVTKAPYALRTAPKRRALPRNLVTRPKLRRPPLPLSPRGAAPVIIGARAAKATSC
jgi:hypothetical protein